MLPPPAENGTDHSPSPSPRAQTPPPPPRAPPANKLWRSAAGRSMSPANKFPRTLLASPTLETQNRDKAPRVHPRSEPRPPRNHAPSSESPRDPRKAAPGPRKHNEPRTPRPATTPK